jgi:hypothetical protein
MYGLTWTLSFSQDFNFNNEKPMKIAKTILLAHKQNKLKDKNPSHNNNYPIFLNQLKSIFLKYKQYKTIGYSYDEKSFLNNKDPNLSFFISSNHGKKFSQLLVLNIFKDIKLNAVDFKNFHINIHYHDDYQNKDKKTFPYFQVNYNNMNFVYKKFSYNAVKEFVVGDESPLKSFVNFEDKEKILIVKKTGQTKIENFFNVIINRHWDEDLIKKYLFKAPLNHEGSITVDNEKYQVYSITMTSKDVTNTSLFIIGETHHYITIISEIIKDNKISYMIFPEINNPVKYN